MTWEGYRYPFILLKTVITLCSSKWKQVQENKNNSFAGGIFESRCV